MELIEALGIANYQVLLAQFFTFAILLFILYKFAYGPMIKMLDDRTAQIDKGLKDAEYATQKLEEVAGQEKNILTKAKKESQRIIASAEELAEKNKAEIIKNSKIESERIINQAQKTIEEEKNKIKEELKKETADLIIIATEKILKEKIDVNKNAEIIKESV